MSSCRRAPPIARHPLCGPHDLNRDLAGRAWPRSVSRKGSMSRIVGVVTTRTACTRARGGCPHTTSSTARTAGRHNSPGLSSLRAMQRRPHSSSGMDRIKLGSRIPSARRHPENSPIPRIDPLRPAHFRPRSRLRRQPMSTTSQTHQNRDVDMPTRSEPIAEASPPPPSATRRDNSRLVIVGKYRRRYAVRSPFDVARSLSRETSKAALLLLIARGRRGYLACVHSDDLPSMVAEYTLANPGDEAGPDLRPARRPP